MVLTSASCAMLSSSSSKPRENLLWRISRYRKYCLRRYNALPSRSTKTGSAKGNISRAWEISNGSWYEVFVRFDFMNRSCGAGLRIETESLKRQSRISEMSAEICDRSVASTGAGVFSSSALSNPISSQGSLSHGVVSPRHIEVAEGMLTKHIPELETRNRPGLTIL